MVKQFYSADTYESSISMGYLLRRGRNLVTAQVEKVFAEKLADQDITFVQWVILMCLRDDLARTPSEICQYICYDSGALTRVVDQMEERGLLTRKRSTEDRRVVELTLTPDGTAMIAKLIALVVDCYNGMFESFSQAEADTLLRLLTKFVDGLPDAPKKGS